jgi:hypothetical protein
LAAVFSFRLVNDKNPEVIHIKIDSVPERNQPDDRKHNHHRQRAPITFQLDKLLDNQRSNPFPHDEALPI